MIDLDPKIKHWIAESESWQAFIDFQIPSDEKEDYSFLKRWEDFYISLMSNALDIISKDSFEEDKKNLLSIAKGLVIYSLDKKKTFFKGINVNDNLLYAAGLYYLAGYSASAYLLASLIKQSTIKKPIDVFILNFLRRNIIQDKQQLSNWLHSYLVTGYNRYIKYITNYIDASKEEAFESNSEDFASLTLAEALFKDFSKNNIWYDLKSHNNDNKYWSKFVQIYLLKKIPIWNFFPSQREALVNGALDQTTCSFQMPTSAGKTALSELIIYNSWKQNPESKILYLAPFRALASELKESIGKDLQKLGIIVKTIYGGSLPTLEERENMQSASLLISTPEKLLAVEDVIPNFLKRFDTIICDEGHLIDDELRGLSYELLLSRLKSLGNENRKFVFISAIIPNIDTINNWLGGNDSTVVRSYYRPTELEYAFLKKRSTTNIYDLQINPLSSEPEKYTLYRFLVPSELEYIKFSKATNKRVKSETIKSKKGLTIASALKVINAGSVAIFCPEKRGASGVEDLSSEVIKQYSTREKLISLIIDKEYIIILADYFDIIFGNDYLLCKTIRLGFLFHHADLPQFIREIIEDTLRQNKVKLVICTNTLAEGVNLPIRTIVIHSTTRYEGKYSRVSLSIRDLKNLVGRAGRAGKETRGLILIPHDEDFSTIERLIRDQGLEDVRGNLYTIVNQITKILKESNFTLTNDILENQSEAFLNLLDSIDSAIIDLVSESIVIDNITEIIQQLIQETLCYYLSDFNERKTLNNLLNLRSEKIVPYITDETFKALKNSGTNIRIYQSIINHFDFNNSIWEEVKTSISSSWLEYILIDGVFMLQPFIKRLATFNEINKTTLTSNKVSEIIRSWLFGEWYSTISQEYGLELYQVLRLINNFISFDLQSLVSSVIKIKTQLYDSYEPHEAITNWPQYLQYGINSPLQLALFELGLNDRVAVLYLSHFLNNQDYVFKSHESLKIYLINNRSFITNKSYNNLNRFSYKNIIKLFNFLLNDSTTI